MLAGESNAASAWARCISLADRHSSDLRHLNATHALFVVHGLHRNTFALSRLLRLAASSSVDARTRPAASAQLLWHACRLFHHAEAPLNAFTYNTVIRALALCSQPERALFLFCLTRKENDADGIAANRHTYPPVLHACASVPSVSQGEQVHALVLKNGLEASDRYIRTALLRFYVVQYSDGCERAHKLFDEIPTSDPIQWDVVMKGYLLHGLPSQALGLFRDVMLSGLEPDKFVLTTAISACAHSGALEQGIWIHDYLRKREFLLSCDAHICTALVSMYAKCGCIKKAVQVFNGMYKRNSFSWAAMIGGFALHGSATEALDLLRRMRVEDGLAPDGVVILGALSACTHAGLVEEGLELLAGMEMVYGIVPGHEHYSCAVDLLCRVGRLNEAVELIRRMPMMPLASVWGSLLVGCRTHHNVKIAELAAEELLKLDESSGTGEGDNVYVQLYNVYLDAAQYEDARRVRRLMVTKGIKKIPGYSIIEVEGFINSFVSGDLKHLFLKDIHDALDLLLFDITHAQSSEFD